MARTYRIVARIFNPPPRARIAKKRRLKHSGTAVVKAKGRRKGREKVFHAQAMTRKSLPSRPFLQRPSLMASQRAVPKERIIHILVQAPSPCDVSVAYKF